MGGGSPHFGGLKIVFPRESMKCNLVVFQRCHSCPSGDEMPGGVSMTMKPLQLK